MVLWDSRLLHCNVPGFHPFDQMDLRTALADVGLEDATQEPRRFVGRFFKGSDVGEIG